MSAAAKITLTLTPSQFDLIRAELTFSAERLRSTVNDTESNPRERKAAREHEARIRDLLAKLQ